MYEFVLFGVLAWMDIWETSDENSNSPLFGKGM